MCGFVGFTAVDYDRETNQAVIKDMADRIAHRGPDDEGFFVDDDLSLIHIQMCIRDRDQSGTIIPGEITVYEDKSFTFVCKTPPAAILIKEKLGIEHGSGIPQLTAVGTLTEDQRREITEIKMPDLNANTVEAAMEIIAGTARSMGVRIEGREMKKSYVPSRKVAAMLQGKELDDE